MKLPDNSLQKGQKAPAKTRTTPHELVDRQIKHFDYHVSDEDMENMEISDRLPEEEKLRAAGEASELQKDSTETSYDVKEGGR